MRSQLSYTLFHSFIVTLYSSLKYNRRYFFPCPITIQCDDRVQVGPDPVIPDHPLCQGAGVLVTVPAVMLVLTYLSVHIVKTTQT